jgi:hypothetical protein
LAIHHISLSACTRNDFAAALTPCLALVGGSGFKGDDRTEWLHAAFMALEGIPADLIRQGARAAMLKADHPSKIVPLIIAEISGDWAMRKRIYANNLNPGPAAEPEREIPDEERAEVSKLMAGLVRRLSAKA